MEAATGDKKLVRRTPVTSHLVCDKDVYSRRSLDKHLDDLDWLNAEQTGDLLTQVRVGEAVQVHGHVDCKHSYRYNNKI